MTSKYTSLLMDDFSLSDLAHVEKIPHLNNSSLTDSFSFPALNTLRNNSAQI